MISRKWRANWANLTPFFDYPPELRKAMYTTNAVESINAQLRKVTKKRGAFPTQDSVRKVLYLAILKASERWSRPIKDWHAAALDPETGAAVTKRPFTQKSGQPRTTRKPRCGGPPDSCGLLIRMSAAPLGVGTIAEHGAA
jgi:hypothetical protein